MYPQILLLEFRYGLYVIATLIGYPLLIVVSIIRALYRCLKTQVNGQKSILGEVAMITGSGRGLGRSIAIKLAKLGCHIAVVDIQVKLAQETAEHIANAYGVKTKAYKIDVTNFEQLSELKTKITADLGDVTILVNNAALLTLSSFDNPPHDEVQRMVNVNFAAIVYATQIFLPKMKELKRGRIANISSMSALVPCHMYAVYAASKAAVRHFTSSLRIELMQSQQNITATTIMPTFINTNDRIDRLMKATRGSVPVPGISGDAVAHYAVQAMLRAEDEVTVPRVFIFHYRFMSLFTTYFLEVVVAIGSYISSKRRNLDAVQKLIKSSDIKEDL